MSLKKVAKVFVKIIFCLIILVIAYSLGACSYWIKDQNKSIIANDYYKMEFYKSTDETTSFSKYYYEENIDIEKKYKLGNDSVEEVRKNIEIAIDKLHKLDNSINIEFDYDIVTSNDFYLLRNDSDFICFQYYDVEEYILYEIYLSK